MLSDLKIADLSCLSEISDQELRVTGGFVCTPLKKGDPGYRTIFIPCPNPPLRLPPGAVALLVHIGKYSKPIK